MELDVRCTQCGTWEANVRVGLRRSTRYEGWLEKACGHLGVVDPVHAVHVWERRYIKSVHEQRKAAAKAAKQARRYSA